MAHVVRHMVGMLGPAVDVGALPVPVQSNLMTPLIASQCVPLFLARLPMAEAAQLKRLHGLPSDAEQQNEVTLPLATLGQFCDDCVRLLGDELLGLHVAADLSRGRYGVLEYAARSAPNFREALDRLVRYGGLVNSTVKFSVQQSPQRLGVVLRHEVPGIPDAVGRQCNEYFVATIVGLLRELVDPQAAPTRVWFAHSGHVSVGTLETWLGCPVSFGNGHNAVEFSLDLVDRPLRTADTALLNVLDDYAAKELASRVVELPATVTATVQAMIPDALTSTGSVVERIAARMGLSSRTLQRRLAGEGVVLQALIDGYRRREAVERVGIRAQSLDAIATLLGYSDMRAFNRAYKRWTGRTPTADRALRAR